MTATKAQADLFGLVSIPPLHPQGGSALIGAKAAYVRSQGQTRCHHCHWPGCTAQVPPAMWGCKPHWFALPQELRTRVWRAYKPGQEIKGTPSAEYVAVAREAQAWIEGYLARQAASIPGLIASGIGGESGSASVAAPSLGRLGSAST